MTNTKTVSNKFILKIWIRKLPKMLRKIGKAKPLVVD